MTKLAHRRSYQGPTPHPRQHSRQHEQELQRTGVNSPERRALRFAQRDPGVPLAPATRATLEPRFGHSFADIRVHEGADASAAANDVRAKAFTVGQDIVFDEGAYAPDTAAGQHLLAHELTHAVQNAGASPGVHTSLVSAEGDAGEGEATAAADAISRGMAVIAGSAPAAVIARTPQASEREEGGLLGMLSSGFGLGESVFEGLAQNQW